MDSGQLERIEFHGDASLGFDNIIFMILASVLAVIALLSGSVPVLIGAMILAPAFEPLVAVPFGAVNRDWALIKAGLLNSFALFVIAFGTCMLTVWLMRGMAFSPSQGTIGVDMITERLYAGWSNLITALAAGAGGALAAASQRQTNIVGVVIALALIPALAAAAIGFLDSAMSGWGGIELFWLNYFGLIVAGFIALEIRVYTGKAKKTTERARK